MGSIVNTTLVLLFTSLVLVLASSNTKGGWGHGSTCYHREGSKIGSIVGVTLMLDSAAIYFVKKLVLAPSNTKGFHQYGSAGELRHLINKR